MIRRLAKRDGLGRDWLKRVGQSERSGQISDVLSKFEQLFSLIMPFQGWKNLGKFIDYGCHGGSYSAYKPIYDICKMLSFLNGTSHSL